MNVETFRCMGYGNSNFLISFAGGASPYVPPMPGHGQFSDQISVKTYVGTGSFYCEMCPRKILKVLNYN